MRATASAENVLQDAAVMVVGDFFGCIHARDDGESLDLAVVRLCMDSDWLLGRESETPSIWKTS